MTTQYKELQQLSHTSITYFSAFKYKNHSKVVRIELSAKLKKYQEHKNLFCNHYAECISEWALVSRPPN